MTLHSPLMGPRAFNKEWRRQQCYQLLIFVLITVLSLLQGSVLVAAKLRILCQEDQLQQLFLFQIRSSEMELSFKITASLLLLVQAFQSASLQDSTDSPGRTIDKSWLRDLVRNRTGGHVVVIPVEPRQGFDATLDPSHDYSGGITSGSMPTLSEEKENKDGDEEPGDLNVVTTPELPKDLNATISATTLDSTNVTGVEKELHDSSTTSPNSTTFMTAENSTHWSDDNQKDSPTTSAPGVDATQKAAATPAEDLRSINATDPTNARTTKVSQTSASFESATNFLPFTSSEMSPRTTSLQVQDTPEVANKSGTAAGTGSSSERGTLPFHLTAVFRLLF